MIPRERVQDVVKMVVRIGVAIQRRQELANGDDLIFLNSLSTCMLKAPVTESLLDEFLAITNGNPNSLDDNSLVSGLRGGSAFSDFVAINSN